MFTPAHREAWLELDALARKEPRTFEQRYPPGERITQMMDAVFADCALTGRGEAPQTTYGTAHARVLINQVRRGWGWGNAEDGAGVKEKDHVRAHASLLAALSGDWVLTVVGLGGRPLARTVAPNKTYGYPQFEGLVRHVATAAKNRLGEGSCAKALRAWAEDPHCTPGPLFALARLAIEVAGGHPRTEVSARFEALLAGKSDDAVHAPRAIVEDPRASVFERYLPVLSDPALPAEVESEWRSPLLWLAGHDEKLALLPALEGRNAIHAVDSAVIHATLGLAKRGWKKALFVDLKRSHPLREVRSLARYGWTTQVAATALAAGDTALVKKLTIGPKRETFKPGKTFGDDARRTLRYFALAVEAGAKQADVTPAWLELLVSRVPSDAADGTVGGPWQWGSLFCLAYCYFHTLGGAPEADVGRLLRETLRGQ